MDLIKYLEENLEILNNNLLSKTIYPENKTRDRNQYQRDYARVLYCPSFRRLQWKMQMLWVDHTDFFRNRLTHSFEVSQIAKSVAYNLIMQTKYKNDTKILLDTIHVVELASLAHDIWNPPFGHAWEDVLNSLIEHDWWFEWNAQVLRILMNLEEKSPKYNWLNLSIRSLLAVTKYFVAWLKSSWKYKKFIYSDNYKILEKEINNIKKNKPDFKVRTLDVQIIDLSDEIAYAAHDLEDTLSLRYFDVDELLSDFWKEYWLKNQSYKILEKIIEETRETIKWSDNYFTLFNRELLSRIVNILISDIWLVKNTQDDITKTGTQQEYELWFKTYDDLAKWLKKITMKCINKWNKKVIYEKKWKIVLEWLFNFFNNKEIYWEAWEILPENCRTNFDNPDRERKIIDYLSSMMDWYAIELYEKYIWEIKLAKILEK